MERSYDIKVSDKKTLKHNTNTIARIPAKIKKPCKSAIYRALMWIDTPFSGTSWDRTSDTRIFSPLLYHLSYGTSRLGLQM